VRLAASTTAQSTYGGPVAGDEGFLLGAGPTLDLSLEGDGVGDALELFAPDEAHGALPQCVIAALSGLMLAYASLDILTAMRADIV